MMQIEFLRILSLVYSQSQDEVSISGVLLMHDGITPHAAVVVQAVIPAADGSGEPTVIASTLSDESGKYELTELSQGQYRVRCYVGDKYLYYEKGKLLSITRDTPSRSHIDFHFAPFKKGLWKNAPYGGGRAGRKTRKIYRDASG